jgi:hypothetical protein
LRGYIFVYAQQLWFITQRYSSPYHDADGMFDMVLIYPLPCRNPGNRIRVGPIRIQFHWAFVAKKSEQYKAGIVTFQIRETELIFDISLGYLWPFDCLPTKNIQVVNMSPDAWRTESH